MHGKENSHKGILEADAPGLSAHINNSFPAPEAERLRSLYTLVCSRGGLNEEGVLRAEGASFNPKPARYCAILAKETSSKPSLFAAALLSALDLPTLEEARDEAPESSTALQALSFLSGRRGAVDAEAEVLVLTILLDMIRHLHMHGASAADSLRRLDSALKLLPPCGSPDSQRLRFLIQTSAAQQRRTHERKNQTL